jgi:hypothetical protein
MLNRIVLIAFFLIQVRGIAETPSWHDSYVRAVVEATEKAKLLFIVFEKPGSHEITDVVEKVPVDSEHVYLRLPTESKLETNDGEIVLREDGFFNDLTTKTGIVVIDLLHKDKEKLYKQVVSVLPAHRITATNIETVIGLPYATLTQRSMVWAIRTHFRGPQSTQGYPDEALMAHAERHSNRMIADERRTPSYLSGSMWVTPAMRHDMSHPGSSEILVSSWPHRPIRDVMDAAEELIRGWHDAYRGVPTGHWGVVMRRARAYGYDMKSVNGFWLATGVVQY